MFYSVLLCCVLFCCVMLLCCVVLFVVVAAAVAVAACCRGCCRGAKLRSMQVRLLLCTRWLNIFVDLSHVKHKKRNGPCPEVKHIQSECVLSDA